MTLKSPLVTVLFPGREQFQSKQNEREKPEDKERPLDFDQNLVRKQVATFDYNPETQSPNDNPEMELPFCEGDVRPDGFFYGEINGIAELVPSNFVTLGGSGQ